jgi:hypothetical protein
MLVWAARDLGRHPWRSLATALTLFALALLLGGTQLLRHAFMETGSRLLSGAPAIVVRRAAPTGWAPLPIETALAAVAHVPGVLKPHARLWGLARVAGRTVAVMAELAPPEAASASHIPPLRPGEVAVGGGLGMLIDEGRLVFERDPQHAYTVVQWLPDEVAMAVHDTVLMHPDDARGLLGIPPGFASDLAIEVFHEAAVEALSRDLSAALPWPVQITSRATAMGRLGAEWSRSATLATAAYIPALLALAVLGLATAVGSERDRGRAGLLRALGWTGRDFLRLCLWRWACLNIPGVGLGLAAAYGLIFTPAGHWMGPFLFGWTAVPPALHLSSAGSAQGLLQTAALVSLPHLAVVVATGLRHAASDPQVLMEEALP